MTVPKDFKTNGEWIEDGRAAKIHKPEVNGVITPRIDL